MRDTYVVGMADIAAHAHRGQTRRGTGLAYIGHPSRVAVEAKIAGLDEDTQAAAWLHDVVEDCDGWTFERLADVGATPRTMVLVRLLTKWWPLSQDTAVAFVEKPKYYAAIAADPDALALKLLDRADNLEEIVSCITAERPWVDSYLRKTTREIVPLVAGCLNQHAVWAFTAAYEGLRLALERQRIN